MQIYNKINELTSLLEQQKQDKQATLEYAKTDLKDYTNELVATLQHSLLQEITSKNAEARVSLSQSLSKDLDEKVENAFGEQKDTLLEQVANNLLPSLQQALSAQLEKIQVQELQTCIKTATTQAQEQTMQSIKSSLQESFKEQVSQELQAILPTFASDIIEKCDFSFFTEMPEIFTPIVQRHLSALVSNWLANNAFVNALFNSKVDEIFNEVQNLRTIKELEFETQLRFQNLSHIDYLNEINATHAYLARLELQRQNILKEAELENLRLENLKITEQRRQEYLNGLPQGNFLQNTLAKA